MNEYKQYRRKQIAELADWSPDMDMTGVSISEADLKSGSPKLGDKIARNPKNHQDRWLVAAAYFNDNFEPINRGVKIICLCGSTRFTPEMMQLSWGYAKVGVLAIGWFVRPTRKGEPEHHLAELEGIAEQLDELHLRRLTLLMKLWFSKIS